MDPYIYMYNLCFKSDSGPADKRTMMQREGMAWSKSLPADKAPDMDRFLRSSLIFWTHIFQE